jgi:hypothetical protein
MISTLRRLPVAEADAPPYRWTVPVAAEHVRTGAWFGNIVIIVFLCLQVLDGLFTYMGVSAFGVKEGNPLIEQYMMSLGVGPGVAAAKLLSGGCACILHLLAFHRLLAILTLVYLSMAILPWAWVLSTVQ